jgi:membrane associated rhomboid family serine protease
LVLSEPYGHRPRWTYIFIVAIVVMFLIQQLTDDWLYLAFFPGAAMRMPWMFVTSIFLHSNVSHLLLNLLALFFLGTTLERIIGNRNFAAIFLVSGVVGNIGYMLTASSPYVPVVGASGAIYGVLGTLAVISPFTLVWVYGSVPVPLIVVAFVWAFLDFTGLFTPSDIAYSAHLAGMLVGLVYGAYVRFTYREPVL